jgi:hypothetical protein
MILIVAGVDILSVFLSLILFLIWVNSLVMHLAQLKTLKINEINSSLKKSLSHSQAIDNRGVSGGEGTCALHG